MNYSIEDFQISPAMLDLLRGNHDGISTMSHEDFIKKYNEKIEYAKRLGSLGCVISLEMPAIEIDSYESLIVQNGEMYIERILNIGIDKICSKLNVVYTELNLNSYWKMALTLFNDCCYMPSAMLILAIFDRRMKQWTTKRKYSAIANEGIENCGSVAYKSSQMNREYSMMECDAVFLYPSLQTFCQRLFIDGDHDIGDPSKEPDYLNRNWLVHGAMTKPVKRYMVIELINALYTMEVLMK